MVKMNNFLNFKNFVQILENIVSRICKLKKAVWLTISLWQVRWLVPVRSVLRGVAMASWILPSDSLRLKTTLLTGRVEPTVPAPCRASGVGVGQRLFTETSLKHRPIHTHTDTHRHTPISPVFCFTGITWWFNCFLLWVKKTGRGSNK